MLCTLADTSPSWGVVVARRLQLSDALKVFVASVSLMLRVYGVALSGRTESSFLLSDRRE